MHGKFFLTIFLLLLINSHSGLADVTLLNTLRIAESAGYMEFGVRVSSAGDVNADGFADVLVGAFGGSNDDFDRIGGDGGAYVFFGGSEMDNVVDLILQTETDAMFYCSSVTGIGDINHDGYDDFAMCIHLSDYSQTEIDVFLCAEMPGKISDLVISNAGARAAEIGDFDGNGYPDMIVGNNSVCCFQSDFTYSQAVNPEQPLRYSSMQAAGDFNNDGLADLIYGSPGFRHSTGKVDIFLGNNFPDLESDFTIIGTVYPYNQFGYSLSCAGDLNRDGYNDVLISAPGYGGKKGQAYVYYGGPAMSTIPHNFVMGSDYYGQIGYRVSAAGDVNGDGYVDFLVGGITPYSNITDVILGNDGETESTTIWLIRTCDAIAGLGDLQNDGFDDIALGDGASNKVHLHFGKAALEVQPDVTISDETEHQFGAAVCGGDVNDDGYNDLLGWRASVQ
ncbi:FG-GAP repeat protein [candidate division KSB1 bacterium]|nr:FG-GAP repeat protein [candidate division KSB1 bacterium]